MNTMNITLAELAAKHNMQPYELAAYLDLGTDYSDDMTVEAWMVEAAATVEN